MKKISYLLFIAITIFSCKKNDSPQALPTKTELNVAYGTDSLQKMDIYLPAGRNNNETKVLILIHGGGWNEGDKKDFNVDLDSFSHYIPGYAIFNINYRLSDGVKNLFPTQENDVKAAIDFIYSTRANYDISDKYVLLGASAGAHLSLLHAYKNTSPVKIKAVVDFFGPSDLVEMYNNPTFPTIPALLAAIIGGTPSTKPVLYQQSSPINFVTSQSPPTIMLHGGQDILLSANQSVILKNKLTAAGVTNQYVFYPTANHGWVGAELNDSFLKIAAFLKTNVQ